MEAAFLVLWQRGWGLTAQVIGGVMSIGGWPVFTPGVPLPTGYVVIQTPPPGKWAGGLARRGGGGGTYPGQGWQKEES